MKREGRSGGPGQLRRPSMFGKGLAVAGEPGS